MSCTGSESELLDCDHIGIGNHNCGHSEDASVMCNDTGKFIITWNIFNLSCYITSSVLFACLKNSTTWSVWNISYGYYLSEVYITCILFN